MLLLCLFALLFTAPVKGTTVIIRQSQPRCTVYPSSMAVQPYIAGYMTTDHLDGNPGHGDAKALRLTVSFTGTNKSVIQTDNWLMAGITSQGPDSVYGGVIAIDWGYVFSLVLDGVHSDPYVHAEVWQCHEWTFPHATAKCVSSWNGFISGLTIDSEVTLTMEWGEYTLDYYAKVGGTTHHVYSYTPNATASHYFMTGTVERRNFAGWPIGGTVKYFEFHAWSKYNIGRVGWHSYLSYPKFITLGESSWTHVSFAYSTDGRYAYLDNSARWGGAWYESVIASYYDKHVHFYPASGTIIKDTLLWEPSGGGGGCPILTVYDGTDYVEEGLLDIHNPEGVDVVYEHTLAATPQRVDGTYLLRLTEHPKTHSYIDQVKLYAMLEDGTLKELPLIWAWHSEDDNVLPMLLHSDEWKTDTLGADHNDGTSQSIDLKFAALSPSLEVTDFMFQIEGNNWYVK